ncbi:MAG: S1 RNA-binding domain-containing protein [Clostridia bacterium]|nr:S1 RNA-binding domain-containing protein [Clostridia bacterium]
MQSKVGEIYEGTVTGLTDFGAFIKLQNGDSGMAHISEVASVYVKNIRDFLSEGQTVKVKVLSVNDNKISLSIKQAAPKSYNEKSHLRKGKRSFSGNQRDNKEQTGSDAPGSMSFEDMMAKFKADSEEKISDLKRFSDNGTSRRRGNK